MKIYIDNDFKCYTETAEGRREFDVVAFEDKCKTFIEGCRYVPSGETWTRADGVQFRGEMIAPWVDYSTLAEAQRNYTEGVDSRDEEVADLMDEIEDLCNELIGE